MVRNTAWRSGGFWDGGTCGRIFLPAGWDAVGYFVSPYDSRTENFSWTGRYGELSPGTYRMVRTYTLEGQDYSVAVEFAVSGS